MKKPTTSHRWLIATLAVAVLLVLIHFAGSRIFSVLQEMHGM